jgi:hypothetical protein
VRGCRVPEPSVLAGSQQGLQAGREREFVPGSRVVVRKSNPSDCSPALPFIVSRGGAQGENPKELQCLAAGTSRRTSLSVGAYRSRVVITCRGSRRVAGLNCSLRDAWPSPWVVWACLSLPECLPSMPRLSLSLGLRASWRVLECLGPSLACGRVGDDDDVMAAGLSDPH